MKDMATAQVEIATQSKRQNDIYLSQIEMMKTMANAAIMNKEISGLDDVTQEFYKLQQEQIMLQLRERSKANAVEQAKQAEVERARSATLATILTQGSTRSQASGSTQTQATTSSISQAGTRTPTQATTSTTSIDIA